MNISKRFKRRTEYRLHRVVIIRDLNKVRQERAWLKALERMKDMQESGIMKILRTSLGPVECKGV